MELIADIMKENINTKSSYNELYSDSEINMNILELVSWREKSGTILSLNESQG